MTTNRPHLLESRIGRLLGVATIAAVGLLALGSAVFLASGRSPLDPANRPLDLGRLLADVVALRAGGLLWLGLLVVIGTPAARVAAALVGYVGARERGMALVSILILLVIAAGVVAGTVGA